MLRLRVAIAIVLLIFGMTLYIAAVLHPQLANLALGFTPLASAAGFYLIGSEVVKRGREAANKLADNGNSGNAK